MSTLFLTSGFSNNSVTTHYRGVVNSIVFLTFPCIAPRAFSSSSATPLLDITPPPPLLFLSREFKNASSSSSAIGAKCPLGHVGATGGTAPHPAADTASRSRIAVLARVESSTVDDVNVWLSRTAEGDCLFCLWTVLNPPPLNTRDVVIFRSGWRGKFWLFGRTNADDCLACV